MKERVFVEDTEDEYQQLRGLFICLGQVEYYEEWIMRIERAVLERFCTEVFIHMGLPKDEAEGSARVLVAADARGIESHGVGRLQRYVNGIERGVMQGSAVPVILRETPMSRVLDAQGAMGMGLSMHAMEWVIEQAGVLGFACASIRNSNHFGIAGFYAEMAARKNMIGICMTNTAALGVPTFAKTAMFGTNPIAFAVPSHGRLFSLDMSTTVVTRGKVEVYAREQKELPLGWAVDTSGRGTVDAGALLEDMLFQRGGGLLPLGGEGERFSGYKGYGLAVMVDILTALTSGGVFGKSVQDSAATSARVCHFFAAIRLDIFRDPEEFKSDMDRLLAELSQAGPAVGAQRVYYAGLKEQEREDESNRIGVEISEVVYSRLKTLSERLGIML